jgi:ABC-type bacteriocin/lantibiotic exporter with double-glycine peptidase domain
MENNIVYYLLKEFYNEEYVNTIAMVTTSFFINLFQSNGISYITANIIEFTYKKDLSSVKNFFFLFIVLSCIYLILYSFYRYFQNKLLIKLRQWVKSKLLSMILLTNNEELKFINFSKLANPIQRISTISFLFFTDFINFLLPNLIFLFVIIVYFLYKNIFFGLLMIFGNILMFIYVLLNYKNMFSYISAYENNMVDSESMLVEILSNLEKIVSRGESKTEILDYDSKINETIRASYSFYENVNYHNIAMSIILYVVIFIAIAYLIYLVFHKDLDVTTFITFFSLLLIYRDKMISTILQVPDSVEFIGRVEVILHLFEDLVNDYNNRSENKYKSIDIPFTNIRFDNVSFQYASTGQQIYDNFSFEINVENKIIGITGSSGKGKSTFAKLLVRLYQPDKGDIYINNVNIKDIDPDYLRKNIVYINQNTRLFDRKLIENIYYACSDPEKCKDNFKNIMEYKKIRELYKNIDIENKEAGAGGEGLSGGQRQVANIISGLISPSKILILDEPTNALDGELKKEILNIIRDLKNTKTAIFIITHDKDCYSLFDDTMRL